MPQNWYARPGVYTQCESILNHIYSGPCNAQLWDNEHEQSALFDKDRKQSGAEVVTFSGTLDEIAGAYTREYSVPRLDL